MEVLALRAYTSGYRGCLIDPQNYLFFQFTRKAGFKAFKTYPRCEFQDHLHFVAMMQKFMSPAAFIIPPIAIEALTLEALAQVHARMRKSGSSSAP